MRPRSLTVDGIAAYRQRTEVPIGDTDLFALVGPTGSGKSSVLDAIILVLYGKVPRFDGTRLRLKPVMTTGRDAATIEFTFDVGPRVYRAIKVFKRTSSGAVSTKEAVFEQIDPDADAGDDVIVRLADSESEFKNAVQAVIGLEYDDFKKVVMLPQGEFAAMLNADAGTRRKMLIDMLGLDIYEKVMQSANRQSDAAKARLDAIADEQQRLADVNEAAVAAATERSEKLHALLDQLHDLSAKKSDAEEIVRARQSDHAKAVEHLAKVTDIPPCPDDVRQLTTDISDADTAVSNAERALKTARDDVDGHAATYDTTSTAAATAREHQQTHERIAAQRESVENLRSDAAEEQAKADDMAAAANDAAEALPAKLDAAAEARRSDAAAHAAEGLHAGDDCPICARSLDTDPDITPNPEMAAIIKAADTAQAEATRLEARAEALQTSAATAETRASAAADKLAAMLADAGELLDDAAITKALTDHATAEAALKAARVKVSEHERQLDTAQKARSALDVRATAARQTLNDIRLGIGDANCPPTDGSLADAWDNIVAWAATEHADRSQAATTTQKACDDAEKVVTDLNATMVAEAGKVDPALTASPRLLIDTSSAAATAKANAERLALDLERATTLVEEVAAQEKRRDVMKTVGELCRSDRIREWLLEDALQRLASRATERLSTLSSGRYEMTYTDGDFEVVDLFEGAATRPIKSLSGGETFLVSLALALALGAEIAANSTATVRADSLFIDEGFGTLDPERLDLVADVLALLGAERTVGIVTHVEDIAERMPTRIEVTAAPPGGSPTFVRHDT